METRFVYTGTGGGLFGKVFVGMLLCLVTLGIYTPWFMVSMYGYILENTTMKAAGGDVKFGFNSKGGELFVKMLVGCLLTMLTLGIYYSWFAVDISKYISANIVGTDAQGRVYNGAFRATGVQMFGVLFVGILLTMITFGIYTPWFLCKFMRFCTENTDIVHDGQVFGKFAFKGEGGTLFGVFLVGMLLTAVTLGIYYFWYQVNLMKFFAENSTVDVNGRTHRFMFTGTGGANFKINLVGTILTILTIGIYGAWYMTNQIRFKTENTVAIGN